MRNLILKKMITIKYINLRLKS